MNTQEIISKVMQKKELSQLPKKDVELAFSHFQKREVSDDEKVRLTRELLHKVFGAFGSKKLLSPKDKTAQWVLSKHVSTRERLNFYENLYKRIFSDMPKKFSLIDLGCGANGFSFEYLKELGLDVTYLGVEAVGQIAELTNNYFKKEKIKGKVLHESLLQLGNIKKLVSDTKKPKIVLLFKALDSLEMLERDYSKKLLESITPISERVVVSFATQSFNGRTKFKVKRYWILGFIEQRFKIVDDFELGGERYVVFEKK